MQNEPPIAAFALNFRIRKIAGKLQYTLETAIGYFQLVVAPSLGDDGVAADSAHDQLVIRDQYVDIVRLDPCEVEFYFPTIRAAVNVDCGLPKRPTGSVVLAADSLNEHPLAS